MKMILNRNYTLSTTLGHSVRFVRGEPTYVPPAVRHLAIGVGAVPADGSDPNVLPEEQTETVQLSPEERVGAIRAAIERIVARNERLDFTAAGIPTVAAVSDMLGWKVNAREIAQEWQARGERALEAELTKDQT